MLRTSRTLALLLPLLVFVAACSGSREATDEPTDLPVPDDRPVAWSEVEDFDASQYRDTPPEEVSVEHDVPAKLMDGGPDEAVTRTMQGFRIQIFSTHDRSTAVERELAAQDWWTALPEEEQPEGLFEAGMPVYVKYIQPYYRVRVGDFASRDEAQRALTFVQREFPEAFITPDEITLAD